MPPGGPDVLVNSTYYDRAINSSDWGNTPDGLVYKSCIYQIPSGVEVDSTHNEIIEASGATLPAPPCPYSRLLKPSAATATKQQGYFKMTIRSHLATLRSTLAACGVMCSSVMANCRPTLRCRTCKFINK